MPGTIFYHHHDEWHYSSEFESHADEIWFAELFDESEHKSETNDLSAQFGSEAEAAAVALSMVVDSSPHSLVEDDLISDFLHLLIIKSFSLVLIFTDLGV